MMGFQFMGIGAWLWMLATVLVVAGLGVLLVSALGGSGVASDDEALAILRSRFARGEIDADEFAKAQQFLERAPSRPSRSRGLFVGVVVLVAGVLLALLAWASLAGMGGMMGFGMMGMMGPGPTAPAGRSVTMAGARFTPTTLPIKVGETVRWFNDDSMPHTVTAADRSWDSGNLAAGASFERRFDAAGSYSYVCLYHSWMAGTIEVTGA